MGNDLLLLDKIPSGENLNQIKSEYVNLEMAKTKFLRIICHGVGTPLNGIVGPIQLLRQYVLPEQAQVLVDIIESSVNRFDSFFKKLFLLEELSLGKYKLQKDNINLYNEVNECISYLTDKIENKNLKVKILFSDEHTLMADKSLMNRCMIHILSNAIKFSKEGEIIEIAARKINDSVFIEFIDRGDGFSDFILENKFRLFVTDKHDTDEGLGLGLCLAKHVISAHKGRINLFNNNYGGASVKIELPYQE